MKKLFTGLVCSLLALLISFSLISSDISAVAADKAPVIDRSQITVNQGISDFVTRLYDICLGRNPDPTGFKTWTEQLSNGENTGVGCAYGFIFSNEFQNKNVSNDQYIELMYNCFFGRASDPEGKANWLNAMNSGMTREELFLGFANSVEFFNLCKTYGITAGCHVLGKDYQKVAKINLFVERLYNIILSRPCDQAGMIDWSTRLANKEISGGQAAYGFIFSDEYKNKNRSDSDFLEDLYNAFMGRASDQGGKAYWQNQINIGRTDRDIFNGFTGSQEFIAICNDYGIDKGGDITTGQTSARAGTNTPSTDPTQPTQPTNPTQPVTPVVTGSYDPDNHGGYWITGSNGSYDQYGYQYNGNGVKVDATQFNNYVNNGQSHCLAYVCSSGYVISYANYQNMNWSVVNDPHFGGRSATTSVYQGAYWMQGAGNNDTEWVAAWLYGTDAAWDAFDTDTHKSQPVVVGLNETVTGQTFMYCEWDASSVYADYDRWANAMSAYSYSNARHSSDVCAQYGVSNETLGDYIMIEWCLGNLDYNLQTLPLPNYVAYTGMGSNNYANYFTTSLSRSTSVYFPTSKTWNYSNRNANVVSTSGNNGGGSGTVNQPAPTITGYEIQCSAWDEDDNEHRNTFTGGSKSDVHNQYDTWCENHGYYAGSYSIYAVYSDGSKKPA